jgi:putative ABC transport system permease protein
MEAVILSLMGGLVGLIVGFAGSKIVSVLSGWPTSVSVLSAVLSFAFSGMVGIFFGFYPAYKASLLNPIDALRYE